MFRTVGGKLFGLVALTGGSALVALAVLAWLMQRQLIDLVDDRMPEALAGLEVELADDLQDVETEVHALETATEVQQAWRRGAHEPLVAELELLHGQHPLIALAAFDGHGRLIAQRGLSRAPVRKSQVSGLSALAPTPTGSRVAGIAPGGCADAEGDTAPAYMILQPLEGLGSVLACLPFDEAFLTHTATKLGVELAMVDAADARLRARTAGFPPAAAIQAAARTSLADTDDGRAWAVQRIDLGEVVGNGQLAVVAAMDVTGIRAIVLRDIGAASAVIALLALFAVVLGSRVARGISTAIRRIDHAMRRVAQGEYAQVKDVRTGDEIQGLATGFNAMVDGLRERDNLRQTFGKYMTRTVMEHLLSGKVELGGETLPATIIFSDIRSFSTISERMDAHALVSLLNEYFAEMVAIIMQEDGVVDKFIGDAIMAVFGAPVTKADDAHRAVRAAVRMRAALTTLNAQLQARGLSPIRAGIGIHTGEVVAGNIGSEARMEYTVIGDAVNVAARLEGATKDLGEDIVISEDTRRLVGEAFTFRPLGELRVKGRQRPVRVFAVDAEREAPDPMG